MNTRKVAIWVAALSITASVPFAARAFSQCGGGSCGITPVGHEYLTVRGAKLVIDEWGKLPKDNQWHQVLDHTLGTLPQGIKNLKTSDYGTKQHNLWAAAMGQRWVDTAGLFVPGSHKGINCWDAVDQMPDAVQYDHALRTSHEEGTGGFRPAITGIRARFKKGFVEAATADEGIIKFWDGGTIPKRFKANKPFFLVGRPIHLIQDSYSPEHTTREANAQHPELAKVLDIHSYGCTRNALWHRHQAPMASNPDHGDIIWAKNGPASIPVMGVGTGNHDDKQRENARGALLATKAVWEGFLEVRAMPAGTAQQKQARKARAEIIADHINSLYLNPSPTDPGLHLTKDKDEAQCKKDTEMPEIATTKSLACLGRIKPRPNTEWDEYLLVPYDWEWTNNENESVVHVAPQNIKAEISARFPNMHKDQGPVDPNENAARPESPSVDGDEGSESGE